MVDRNIGLEQFAHDVGMAVMRRRDQSDAAGMAVDAFEVGPGLERQAQDFEPAFGCGMETGRILEIVPGEIVSRDMVLAALEPA
jgi:hypothetical protein